ncbi:hypothetical protein [Anaeromyxobacter oryzae]|uniref:Uncharacterized protein n=1 Tax=Anaeromyxobacter oryzae TaxID=2918170 RepID=A0ABN6MQ12_9BACT|nr:hypothetical protein [Anaeromyxobacter oryzae]BDG03096.1 hypothetical protein AMOR_20920 [Anaeromyxobacter oryzae]
MDRRARARDLLVSALAEVDAELAAPRYRLGRDQLDTCRATLAGYLAALDAGDLPPRRDRGEGLGRIIVDSWPYDVPLGNAILQAERAWRNC